MATKFTVTDQHIKLLQAAYTSWNSMECGAPSIDPKYPYGDSWFLGSIARAIGMPMPVDEDGEEEDYGEFTPEQENEIADLHMEMQIVLQILLDNCVTGIQPGVYLCLSRRDKGWVRLVEVDVEI